jgi:DNA polymerase-3 subunit beta
MFELTINKQQLLTPLLTVANAVDKKQSLSILSNILLKLMDSRLFLTATDLEIEITGSVAVDASEGTGIITVPAKKIMDIIRSLDDDAHPTITFKDGLVTIKEGRSQFKLATLPADNYPNSDNEPNDIELKISKNALVHLFQSTHFAMSQQDVRVFLNGLLLELDHQLISAVATDGHRMAICRLPYSCNNQLHRCIIPRKGVQELLKLLSTVTDDEIVLSVGKSHFKLLTHQYTFSTKLLEARFPPYTRAIPTDQDKQVIIERDLLKRALSRIIILAHEKSKAVLLHVQKNQLTLIANNQEQEEAIEVLPAETQGDELKIAINASYLLDVLHHMEEGSLRILLATADSSILIESLIDEHYAYIIMPMKI